MDKGDKVQVKRYFRLRNAIVDLVLNDKVQVGHDVWRKKYRDFRSKERFDKPKGAYYRCIDVFDLDNLKVING